MDTSRFIICRASAGSGKTYTLVRQYLLLSFAGREEEMASRFKRILAITFTNKAANEMKERILRELDAMAARGADTPMGADIAARMQLDSDTLRRYAREVRRGVLHGYSDFAVCTIDSFVHRIVRTFAHDLGLPLNFDVQVDNDELIQNAVEELMTLAGTEGQEELTEVLCDFAESRMADGKSYMIERELAELAGELFKERTPHYLGLLKDIESPQFGEMQRSMAAANRAYERQMRALGQEGMDTIAEAGLAEADFYHGTTGAGAYFRKLAEGQLCSPNSYVAAYLEGDKLGSAKCTPAVKDRLEEARPRLREIEGSIARLREGEGVLYNSRKLLLKNIYTLALLNKMNQLVERYARENEVVHISEFNRRIAEVVQDEPAPFIYERIGNRYSNYLIDEFQDTSRLQWQNLVPLVENGVGGGHTSLVVGDGKQAIYRFRQGDVGQFVMLPAVDNAVHGRLLERPGTGVVEQLGRNFRSARGIVEFNNSFFEWAVSQRFADNAELHDIYIGPGNEPSLRQEAVKEGGYVQAGFWEEEKDRTALWDEMATDIADLTSRLGYSLSDITVLARTNRILAEVTEHFTRKGIAVVSNESFLLSGSSTVMLMRSVLQYLLDNGNRAAAARVVMYLNEMGLTDIRLDDVFLDQGQAVNLDRLLQQQGLELDCNRLRTMGLYDCCEEMLRMLHLDGHETAYTSTFLNVVARYAGSHRLDVAEFLEWFDEQKDRLSTNTAADLDAVRLMTIHKAKGLEAPVVLYPVLNERPRQDAIWVETEPTEALPLPTGLVHPKEGEPTVFDAQYDEERRKTDMDNVNVLYVALTRPKEKLMLYCQKPKKAEGKGYTSLLMDYFEGRADAAAVREGVVGIGENSPKQAAHAEGQQAETIHLGSSVYPDWTDRIAIAEQASKALDRLEGEAVRHGNRVHEILARVFSADDLQGALDSYATLNHLDSEDVASLRTTLEGMMAQPEVARFFDPSCEAKTECDIVWQGEVIRPDRIVYTPQGVCVVDYKTGRPTLENKMQVMHYCDALRAMGHATVRGYLLYIYPGKCQLLPCE